MIKTISTPTNITAFWQGTGFENGSISVDLMPHPDTDDWVWWLSRALVQPDSCRSKGIGSQLMIVLKEEIKKSECKRCVVAPGGYNSTFKQQANFYKKNGFVVVKGTKGKLLELLL
jgi:GNAT superfamily N-acetyltransferase